MVMSFLFDVIADLPEGITVVPVSAANKQEALNAGKELFPGHRVTVVLKEGEPKASKPRANPKPLKPIPPKRWLPVGHGTDYSLVVGAL
jgi:hypothetical protein